MKLSEVGQLHRQGAIVTLQAFLDKAPADECWSAREIAAKLGLHRPTVSRIMLQVPEDNRIYVLHEGHLQWILGSKQAIMSIRKRLEGK